MGLFSNRKKKDADTDGMEMRILGEESASERQEEQTEYKPINWRRIFLTPKYIRMSTLNIIENSEN
jgi:hypothetical protein